MASSSCSPRTWNYEVFPSFSGADVRKTFLSHLLKELKRISIKTFIDNGIERSHLIADKLLSAIRESRISIVVFSKNYVSSTWCLNELAEIHKCFEQMNQMVIPVFYQLDPSHVRKQTGEFGEAFDVTCKGQTEDDKERWKKALVEVAGMAGYDSQNWNDEAEAIEQISKDLVDKLLRTPCDDFRDFVGIQAHIKAIVDSLLCLESGGVRIVGIVGPSGIGKSSIARALYNQLSSQFEHRAFETYKRSTQDEYSMKLDWAQQFLSKVLGQNDIKIESLGMVEQRLKHWKVLTVLDDVDDRAVLEALVGQTEWFGSGSRVIVVTQDWALLKSHKIDLIYEVDYPSEGLALQMFCQSAFGQTSPPDGFRELAVEVAKLAGNLPLGLKLLGSSLRVADNEKDKKKWVESMPSLRNELNGNVKETFKVCYDRLADQDIFIFIACLFNGESVEHIRNLLRDDVYIGLRVLVDKSLIRVTPTCGTVQMHILLQEFGREIVRAESIYDPGKRRFLVAFKDVYDLVTGNSGTKTVLGIHLDTSEIEEPLLLNEKSFVGMRNLQFIKFNKKRWARMSGEVRFELLQDHIDLPCKLRLLHWDEYPATYIPSSLGQFLVELRMEDSMLEKMWQGTQALPSLKKMNIARSIHLKEIPDLSGASNLEILDFSGCKSLVTLPCSIGSLKKLIHLDMAECSNLEVLPADVELGLLDYLNLRECSRLRSFPRISRNITRLYLNGTAMEEEDCFWIENLSGLTILVWKWCPLRCMPSNFHWEHLTELEMSCSKLEKLWEGVQWLGSLIERMDLKYNVNLRELPDFSNATSLMELDLSGCVSLKEIPDLFKAINLEKLCLFGCENLRELPDFSNATSLMELDLSGCVSLKEIPDLSKAINLEDLCLFGCENLKEIPDLSMATNLQMLRLENCTSLVKFPSSIQHLDELWKLNMRGCTSLEILPTNINLVCSSNLDLSGCARLRTFPQLSTSIYELNLSETAIEEVPSWIENITGLTRMYMSGCQKLRTISATIWNLKYLKLVDFTNCGGITSISDTCMVKTVAELHAESIENHPMDMYPSWSVSNTKFMFCDCFNLDRDAQKFIFKSDSSFAVLPGKGVPTYFTHRTCESSLIVPLPQSSLSQNKLGFTACILPGPVTCCFLPRMIISVHWKFWCVTGVCSIELPSFFCKDQLVIFHFDFCPQVEVQCPPSQLACNNVEFEFELRNTASFPRLAKNLQNSPINHRKIKGCGVRVLNVSPSQDDNDKSSETEHTDLCGENDEESGRSKKRIRMTVVTSQEPSNALCGQTAVNSGSMALNLELSLGLFGASPHVSSRSKVPSPSVSSRNFHGDEASLNLSLSPFDPCLEGESLYFDPMITEQQHTGTPSEKSFPQLINFFS